MYRGIAISGKAGAGKDTACNELMRNDSRYVRISFADELKRIAGELTGLDFTDEKVKEANRWFLQVLGTELMRRFDENYWVKKAVAKAERLIAEGKIPICTDARFPNEIDALKAAGFYAVRLNVSEDVQRARGREPTYHASEIALDDYKGFNMNFNSGMITCTPQKLARAIETFGGFNGYLAGMLQDVRTGNQS